MNGKDPETGGRIEITPEMIEAGVAVLWASGAVEEQLGSDRILVEDIFQAMTKAQGSRSFAPGSPEYLLAVQALHLGFRQTVDRSLRRLFQEMAPDQEKSANSTTFDQNSDRCAVQSRPHSHLDALPRSDPWVRFHG